MARAYPKKATYGTSETFEPVVFSSYKVRERALYLEERRLTIGEPTWKSLDCEAVEALVSRWEIGRLPPLLGRDYARRWVQTS
jgi:hypothetical protein